MKKVSNPLVQKLDEHMRLIKTLCECYDQGNDIVAKSIATAIRVLVHDTASSRSSRGSKSLLGQLAIKSAKYLSTNFRDARHPVHLGLVRRINVGVNDGEGGEAKYWPLCDERYFPSPKVPPRFLSFDDWWGERVFENSRSFLTRRDLVLAIVNKDGGAHFDAEVEERYDDFRKSWSGGSSLVGRRSGKQRGYDNVPTHPAARQIAYELLHSPSLWA
jgi:hypothetical protein